MLIYSDAEVFVYIRQESIPIRCVLLAFVVPGRVRRVWSQEGW